MWHSRKMMALFLLSVFYLAPANAEIDYFNRGIDYWNDKFPSTTEPASNPAKPANTKAKASQKKHSDTFDWKPYLDPSKPEFFQEGDYIPPEPFMEIVRNPSDENLKLWFSYIEKRNKLARRLFKKMTAYVAKTSSALPANIRQEVRGRIESLPITSEDQKRFRFRLYVDSSCPHCMRMLSTMAELAQRGYFVEARQIDRRPMKATPIATVQASKEEVEKQNIRSVPYLLIGDLVEKAVYTLTGYHSADSILKAIRQRRAS